MSAQIASTNRCTWARERGRDNMREREKNKALSQRWIKSKAATKTTNLNPPHQPDSRRHANYIVNHFLWCPRYAKNTIFHFPPNQSFIKMPKNTVHYQPSTKHRPRCTHKLQLRARRVRKNCGQWLLIIIWCTSCSIALNWSVRVVIVFRCCIFQIPSCALVFWLKCTRHFLRVMLSQLTTTSLLHLFLLQQKRKNMCHIFGKNEKKTCVTTK